MSFLEMDPAVVSLVSVITSFFACITALWGTKKDRQAGEANAAKFSLEAAEKVRKDMEANLDKQIERMNADITHYRDENNKLALDLSMVKDELRNSEKKWAEERLLFEKARMAEREEFILGRAEAEKKALAAEGKLAVVEMKVCQMEARLGSSQAQAS